MTALKNNSKTALSHEDGTVGTRQFSIVNDRTDGGCHKVISEHVSNVFLLKERKNLEIKRHKMGRRSHLPESLSYQK